MVENEPAGDEIEGEAVILISRNERGGMEASGTFTPYDRGARSDPLDLRIPLFSSG